MPDVIRLLQFTDTHLMSDPVATLRGVPTQQSLAACLAHARRHGPADLVAVTGDLVQDDPGGYAPLELLLDGLGAPVLLGPGNHDDPAELRRRLAHPPFQVGGAWQGDGWLVVMLETWFADSADGEGRLGPEALARLDDMLRAHADHHALVLLHHPPLPMDAPSLDELGLTDAPDLLEVLGRHGQVRGVGWGHAHQALDVYRGATRWMCTPSTCFQFRPRDPGFERDDRPPGYRVLDLHEDGSIASEVVWLEGWRP